MPKICPTVKGKGKEIYASREGAGAAAQGEKSVADSHVDREEIEHMQKQIQILEGKLAEKEGEGSHSGGRSTPFSGDLLW